jgi:hypothetical protein
VQIQVTCDEETGKWNVLVVTYQYNNDGLEGRAATNALTMDGDNKFVGTVDVPMYDVFDQHACTMTLQFG